jgi:hypothetical protein
MGGPDTFLPKIPAQDLRGNVSGPHLCKKLLSKTANGIQFGRIRKDNLQFLYANRLVRCKTLANRIGSANKAIIENIPTPGFQLIRDQSLGLLIGISNDTERSCRTVNAIVVAPDSLAMLFEHREFVLKRGKITRHVTGIAVLRHQFQRDLLTTACNQQGNVRFLDAFGLIDSSMYLTLKT